MGMAFTYVERNILDFGTGLVKQHNESISNLSKDVRDLRTLFIKSEGAQKQRLMIEINNDVPITPRSEYDDGSPGLYFDVDLFDQLKSLDEDFDKTGN
jgi:hypothetical protein